MANDFKNIQVPISKLKNDQKNPRHPEMDSQLATIEWMLKEHGAEILTLANDITENGLNPIDNILAVESEDKKYYVVVEGNRRLTALKLLANPALATDSSWAQKFNKLSKKNGAKIPKKVNVVLAPNRESIYWILDRRHLGADQGRGLVSWNPQQRSRALRDRNAKTVRYSRALNVIDYAVEKQLLGTQSNALLETSFPITSLDRVLSDKGFTSGLGICFGSDNRLQFVVEVGAAHRSLTKILKDLADGLSVREVINSDQRSTYLSKIKSELPNPEYRLSEPVDISSTRQPEVSTTSPKQNHENDKPPQTGKLRSLQDPRKRKSIIVNSFQVKEPNIRRVYQEFRNLNVQEFPHAVACLMRILIEQSLDHYVTTHSLNVQQKRPEALPELKEKIKTVGEALINKKLVPRDFQKAIKGLCNGAPGPSNPDNLNMRLHSKHFLGNINELIDIWDGIYGPLMEALWGDI